MSNRRLFNVNLDLGLNELLNAKIESLSVDPSGGSLVEGRLWYNSVQKQLKYFSGASISTVAVGDDLTTAVTRAAEALSAGALVVSAGADRSAKSYDGGVGIIKSDASGVVSPAIAGADYLTGASENVLTNKVFDANDVGNSIFNLEVADFATDALGSVAENSAIKFVTSQGIKTYVDGLVSSLGQLVGSFDASTGFLPTTGSGAAGGIMAGDHWRVVVAGNITDLGHLEIGDALMAGTDMASIAANFFVLQANLTDSVSSDGQSSVNNAVARFDGVSGRIVKNSPATIDDHGSINIPAGQAFRINGVDILTQNARKFAAAFNNSTDWAGVVAPFSITILSTTHGLGATGDLVVGVRDINGDAVGVADSISATGLVTVYSNTRFAGRITILG